MVVRDGETDGNRGRYGIEKFPCRRRTYGVGESRGKAWTMGMADKRRHRANPTRRRETNGLPYTSKVAHMHKIKEKIYLLPIQNCLFFYPARGLSLPLSCRGDHWSPATRTIRTNLYFVNILHNCSKFRSMFQNFFCKNRTSGVDKRADRWYNIDTKRNLIENQGGKCTDNDCLRRSDAHDAMKSDCRVMRRPQVCRCGVCERELYTLPPFLCANFI